MRNEDIPVIRRIQPIVKMSLLLLSRAISMMLLSKIFMDCSMQPMKAMMKSTCSSA